MDLDPDFARALNAVLMAVMLALLVGVRVSAASPRSASTRADRFSVRVRLPYGTEAVRESVAYQTRIRGIATANAMCVTVVAASPLLLTPLATSPLFMIVLLLAMLLAVGFTSAAVQVRERLFQPAPDAVRVARARQLGIRDYLDRFRRWLPWTVAGAAAVTIALVVVAMADEPRAVDDGFARAAFVAAAVTAVVCIVAPPLERRILSQPQPASDTLELAWDDALRATALGAVRLTIALSAWVALTLAIGALWLGAGGPFSSFAGQLPTWGVIALQFVYPSTGRRLRPELYPDWLRQPLLQGAAA
jgi:hypothetical protein